MGFNKNANGIGDNIGAVQFKRNFSAPKLSEDMDTEKEGRFETKEIPVGDIVPRPINRYSQGRIERLAQSIKRTNNRLIHPIVIVRPKDLPEDSEIRKTFIEKGIDPDGYKYVIVAGERRFRAWNILKDEAEKENIKNGIIGVGTPFDTITANVLSKKEAKNEKAYYNDSNTESRQLNMAESILHVKDALSLIDTPEKKRNALIEMNNGSEEGIPVDPTLVERTLNQTDYLMWYLENELGISGWVKGTVKKWQAVVNKCIDPVVDAVIQDKIKYSDAKAIRSFDPASQERLLNLLLNDNKDEFNRQISASNNNEKPKRITNRNAADKIKKGRKLIETYREEFKEINDKLGVDDKEIGNRFIKLLDELLAEAEKIQDELK